MAQEKMTAETALSNLVAAYKQVRLTSDEHEIMKESVQVIIDLINRDSERKATSEAKTPKKG